MLQKLRILIFIFIILSASLVVAAGSLYTSQNQANYNIKQINFTDIGDGYLYNTLLGSGESLIIDGLDAHVL
jgi:hypothetical protein